MAKRIIQFGTSRFLQAHADLFIHEAREAGQNIGPITVVKTTRGGERARRVSAFGAEAGYTVIIRGLVGTNVVNEARIVKSVDGALIADRDWRHLTKLFAADAKVVISNVGESGYAVPSDDEIELLHGDEVPLSFPAKLLSLLAARFRCGGQPMLILPCELVPENGKVLRQILVNLAQKWKLDEGFNTFINIFSEEGYFKRDDTRRRMQEAGFVLQNDQQPTAQPIKRISKRPQELPPHKPPAEEPAEGDSADRSS